MPKVALAQAGCRASESLPLTGQLKPGPGAKAPSEAKDPKKTASREQGSARPPSRLESSFRDKESRSLIPVLFATTSPGLRGGRFRGEGSSRLTLSPTLEQIKNISIRPARCRNNEYACVQIRRRRPAPAHSAPGRRADPWPRRLAVRNLGYRPGSAGRRTTARRAA